MMYNSWLHRSDADPENLSLKYSAQLALHWRLCEVSFVERAKLNCLAESIMSTKIKSKMAKY